MRGLHLALHRDSSHDDDGGGEIRHEELPHKEYSEDEGDADGREARTRRTYMAHSSGVMILNKVANSSLMFLTLPMIAMIASQPSSTSGISSPTNTVVKHAQRQQHRDPHESFDTQQERTDEYALARQSEQTAPHLHGFGNLSLHVVVDCTLDSCTLVRTSPLLRHLHDLLRGATALSALLQVSILLSTSASCAPLSLRNSPTPRRHPRHQQHIDCLSDLGWIRVAHSECLTLPAKQSILTRHHIVVRICYSDRYFQRCVRALAVYACPSALICSPSVTPYRLF